MSDNERTGIINVSIENEMKSSYLDYAMSVIVSRAIPDVRDGLKPVHRRILYAMHEIDCSATKHHKKSARIIGEVIGKYHPHSDASVYDALVRMAQDFSLREMLVDGQGNFGSIDADPPASMRYTEVRLKKLTMTMLEDLENETVEYKTNYDGNEQEPVVLPSSFPNILVNGADGIAVGMATNIATHNLGEVIDACCLYTQNNDVSVEEIMNVLPGPDFPTGGSIIGKSGIIKTMQTGRGTIVVRGKTHVEEIKGNREAIIITEIPYQVVKTKIIESVASLVKDKKLEGISEIRDESNKEGIRVVIELKKDISSTVVLNHLYKYTPLQTTFSSNVLALNMGRPDLLNIRSIIKAFIDFREDVIRKRLSYHLRKIRDKAHILIGLRIAIDSIDEMIKIIRGSASYEDAKNAILSKSWPANSSVASLIELVGDKQNRVENGRFYFTLEQVKGILEMKLSKLTGLEGDKLSEEIQSLSQKISELLRILSNREELMGILYNELIAIKEKFATPRRTTIEINEAEDTNIEDLIEKEDILVLSTANGYIKRLPVDSYSVQNRGGKGKIGIKTNDDDDVVDVLFANTHSKILFFSNRGMVYRMKGYQIPLGAHNTKGRAMINLLPLAKDEKINNFVVIPDEDAEFSIIFATKKGNIRRSDKNDFHNIPSNGKIAMKLDEDDALIGVKIAQDKDNIMLATKSGMATRFPLEDLRIIKSRNSDGVRGIRLKNKDQVVSLCILKGIDVDNETKDQFLSIPYDVRSKLKEADDMEIVTQVSTIVNESGERKINLSPDVIRSLAANEEILLTITENGFGKRTSCYEYRTTGRGGVGVINISTSKRNGGVVATFVADDEDTIILITSAGKIIRCPSKGISIIGRNTQGVRIMDKDKDDIVVSVERV